ncbi:MAG: hypothetical protein L0Y66_05740 [Myxococcaceae bacterium]|nr:hypothetical protein [Myxococcaceae bacterium]
MRRTALALLLLSLSACDEPVQGAHPGVTDEGPGLPVDHPAVDEEKSLATTRGVQRLTVEQLRQSFPVVMGEGADGKPITWMRGSTPGLNTFARSLGEADYANVVVENLEASPLYAKFMDDAARDVCNRALAADATRQEAATRTLYRHLGLADTVESNAAGVDRNLRYLKLRFHGVRVADDDAASLAPLRTLFSTAVKAAAGTSKVSATHVKEGWRVVCVALVTAPEFHLY